jgi:glucose-6-phosphate 1-epimerase
MNRFELNTQFAIANQLSFGQGNGDWPFIQIHNAHARATISLYGGQVLGFHPHHTTDDLMFLSERAFYEQGKAIKGGAPICWPWFGADTSGMNRGAHGFARNQLWRVVSTRELADDGATEVVLALNPSPKSLELWAHTFELTSTITVGKTLKIALVTCNTSDTPMHLTQAIHTYFKVGDIGQTQVLGLENTQYIDNAVGGNREIKPQMGAIDFTQEVDRIYTHTPPIMQIVDAAWQRNIQIQATGSHSTVVWNPWVEIAKKSADLNDGDYQKFVCVETANAADDCVQIAPNASHTLSAEYSITSLLPTFGD